VSRFGDGADGRHPVDVRDGDGDPTMPRGHEAAAGGECRTGGRLQLVPRPAASSTLSGRGIDGIGTGGRGGEGMTGGRTRAWDDDGFDDRVPFLARLEKEDRAALLAAGRPLRYRERAVIMHQDEPSTHVLLLLHGWTKVTAIAANGYEALLALRGPGDLPRRGHHAQPATTG
jgi:hypothetical protein